MNIGADLFYSTTNVTVYYLPGTKGWGSTFAGRPRAPWVADYAVWTDAIGLAKRYPLAAGQQDDADGDGLTNLQELQAGTDPMDAQSGLVFEPEPKPELLAAADQTPVPEGQLALYFRSVPGKSYELMSTPKLGDQWSVAAAVTAHASQKRVLLDRPLGNVFYRILALPVRDLP